MAGFSTRGHLATGSDGELRIAMSRDWFRQGVSAEADDYGNVVGLRAIVQNQKADRSMPISLMLLRGASGAGPESGDVLLSSGPISTPVAGDSAFAFDLRVSLATPARVVPTKESWFLAIKLPAAVDGSIVSVHAAATNIGEFGESVRAGAPAVLQVVDRTRGTNLATRQRTAALFALLDEPVLSAGADVGVAWRRGPNPSFGMTGLFPSRERGDGFAFRVEHAASPGAFAAVLGTPLGFLDRPLRFPGIHGALLLTPPLMPTLVLQGWLDASGRLVGISPNAPHPFHSRVGPLQFQAVVASPAGLVLLSNAVGIDDR